MKHFNCIALGVGLLVSQAAFAADTGQLPCKTTKECNDAAASIGAKVPGGGAEPHTSPTDAAEDQFYWVNKINKASTVMLVEEGIFPKDVGQLIAKGVDYTIRQSQQPGGKRPDPDLRGRIRCAYRARPGRHRPVDLFRAACLRHRQDRCHRPV